MLISLPEPFTLIFTDIYKPCYQNAQMVDGTSFPAFISVVHFFFVETVLYLSSTAEDIEQLALKVKEKLDALEKGEGVFCLKSNAMSMKFEAKVEGPKGRNMLTKAAEYAAVVDQRIKYETI